MRGRNLYVLAVLLIMVGPALGDTVRYEFVEAQSTVLQHGGFAGVHITYSVAGRFVLTVDFGAGVASFDAVDANLSEIGLSYTQDLNELFNMTELVGTVINDTQIHFVGKNTDIVPIDVNIMVTLADGSVVLTGGTEPPCCDFFIYTIDALAVESARTIYVDADANGLNDGSSWADAYNYLQDALADANTSAKPIEIHVAEGIYTPDSNSSIPNGSGDRTATFQLINGVTLKGGYAGCGTPDSDARDIKRYETILSGDLNGNDIEVNDPCDLPTETTRAENCYHVVTGNNTDSNAILDGFTITGGNANGSWQYHQDEGGGIHNYRGSPRIGNCTISANSASEDGGGIYNTMLSHSVLTNCIFNGNSARWGGGMRNQDGSNPTLTNCEFIGNKAIGPYATGGGLYGVYGSITNCTFSGNSAQYAGGGMANCGGPITYCTITGNSAGSKGGGMHCDTLSPPSLTHCTVAGNTARWGGAMYFPSTPTIPPPCPGCPPTPPPQPITIAITSCTFIANSVGEDGGAIYHIDSGNHFIVNPVLTNCVFSENSADNNGGAMYHDYYIGNVMLTKCTISRNLAGNSGGGTYRAGGSSTLTNSILWANSDSGGTDESAQIYYTWTMEVNYCCVQGWTGDLGGIGNIGDDPCFADINKSDYHLKSQAGRWDVNSGSWVQDDVTSPCIDAGDPMDPIGPEPFPNGGRVNMGAYGGTAEASKSYFGRPVCEIIVAGDVNGDCKVNFLDFRIMALHWLQDHNPPSPPLPPPPPPPPPPP